MALKNDRVYGNCRVLHPDGRLMFLSNEEKIHWYLKRDLAIKECDEPPTIRLIFNPKGEGQTNPFFLEERDNRCVCCGRTDQLSRHHCVPICIRRSFPHEAKDYDCHDIVPLCVDCHHDYEIHASDLKDQIIREAGLDIDFTSVDKKLLRVKKLGHALRWYADVMPLDRKTRYLQELKDHFNKEVTEEIIEMADALEVSYTNVWKLIVEKVDVQELAIRWRQHFVDTMKPQFMPSNWKVHHQRNVS